MKKTIGIVLMVVCLNSHLNAQTNRTDSNTTTNARSAGTTGTEDNDGRDFQNKFQDTSRTMHAKKSGHNNHKMQDSSYSNKNHMTPKRKTTNTSAAPATTPNK